MATGDKKRAVMTTDIAAIHATGTTNTTGATIAKRTYFYLNGTLVQAIEDISSGQPFTSGTNYETVTAGGLNELRETIDSRIIVVWEDSNLKITHNMGPGVWLVTASTSVSSSNHQFVAIVANNTFSHQAYYPMTILNRGNTSCFPSYSYTNGVFTLSVAYSSFATFTYLGDRFNSL